MVKKYYAVKKGRHPGIYKTWTEPAVIGKDKYETPHKELWYKIRSYITKKQNHSRILKYLKKSCTLFPLVLLVTLIILS